MTRVLMLLSNGFTHDPRVAAEASSLVRSGYDVTVLGWDRDGTLPPEESKEGVRVVRIRNTFSMRLRTFDLFRLRPFWRLAARRALAIHAAKPFDVVHSHDLDTLPAAVEMKGRTTLPVIYDAHEFFPDMIAEGRARLWARRFAELERRLVRHADAVIVASPAQRDSFAALTRAPVVPVMNCKPFGFETYEPPAPGRFRAIYLGGLEPGRMILELADLAWDDPTLDVWIGGKGALAEELRGRMAPARPNFRFLGFVPMSDVIPLTREANVVVSVFNPSRRLYRDAAPNKFFEALVAGRPVLVAEGTWLASEVRAADCGLAIPYSRGALRDALRRLRTDAALADRLGRNAFRLGAVRYNWSREEAEFLRVYENVLSRR